MAPEPGFLKCGADPKAKAFFDADTGEWFTRAQLSSRVTAFADRLRFPAKALGFHFALNDGDSLIATRVLSAVARTYGAELSFDDFLAAPTPAAVATKIAGLPA